MEENMADSQQRPRDEKEEKERSEKEEKPREKEEKGRTDPLSAVVWGAIIIWAGLVLLADNLNLLSSLKGQGFGFPAGFLMRLEAWALIFIGAGVIVLLEVVVRLTVPSYRRPVVGSLIFAIILLTIGLGNLVGWGTIWPLALIIAGVVILLGAFFRRPKSG
jgi:hypothetical protein